MHYTEQQRQAMSEGGKKSKRGPAYDYTLVRAYDGISNRIVAQTLGWSERSVIRARKRTCGYGVMPK
jgi:hypothetical protein